MEAATYLVRQDSTLGPLAKDVRHRNRAPSGRLRQLLPKAIKGLVPALDGMKLLDRAIAFRRPRSRGASNTRVVTISRSAALLLALLAAMLLLLVFQFTQIVVQTIEALLPEAAIVLRPVGDFLEVCQDRLAFVLQIR